MPKTSKQILWSQYYISDYSLNSDWRPKDWSKSTNEVGEICLHRDMGYRNAGENHDTTFVEDEILLYTLNILGYGVVNNY